MGEGTRGGYGGKGKWGRLSGVCDPVADRSRRRRRSRAARGRPGRGRGRGNPRRERHGQRGRGGQATLPSGAPRLSPHSDPDPAAKERGGGRRQEEAEYSCSLVEPRAARARQRGENGLNRRQRVSSGIPSGILQAAGADLGGLDEGGPESNSLSHGVRPGNAPGTSPGAAVTGAPMDERLPASLRASRDH